MFVYNNTFVYLRTTNLHSGGIFLKTEELSCKCPKCGCVDKHIIRGDDPSGSIIGVEYKHTGTKAPKGSHFRCTECGHVFKECKI